MNKNTNSLFGDLNQTLLRRNQRIGEALLRYRSEREQIETTYREELAKAKVSDLEDSTRAEITAADKEANENATVKIGELRKILNAYISEPGNPTIIDQLRVVKDFDLSLTKDEITGFAEQCGGNLLTLRCLETVAHQSGYKLTYAGAGDYEEDLNTIETLFRCPSLYSPADLLHEAMICSPNKKWRGIDYGRPQTFDFATGDSGSAKLLTLSERWNSAVSFEITEEGKTKKTDAKALAPGVTDTANLEQAAEIGQVKAETMKAVDFGKYQLKGGETR